MKLILFRNIVFFILFFLTNSLVYSNNDKMSQSEQTIEKGDVPKVSSEQKIKTKHKQPAEFKPSEKIKSDISVSFPVDI